MTAQEWKLLAELLQRARKGDEKAVCEVCKFIDSRMKPEIAGWLWKAGVGNYVDEAYQDVLLAVLRKIPQLEVIDCWKIWLRRVAKSIAKKYRPRYLRYPRPKQAAQKAMERPKQSGTNCVSINCQVYPVKNFELDRPRDSTTSRQRVFEPLSDSAILKWSSSNRPDYPRSIDLQRALSKLPERWALAIQLVYFEGYSRTEAAQILKCSRNRIYKLLQKARTRLRKLLVGYARKGKAKSESRCYSAKRRVRVRRALATSDVSPRGCAIRVIVPLRGRFSKGR